MYCCIESAPGRLARPSMACHGLARPGTAWHGLARPGTACHDLSRPTTAYHGRMACHGLVPRPAVACYSNATYYYLVLTTYYY